jgi:formate dehydrogenase subunit delta
MRIERLVSMANDIGSFFNAESDKTEAAKSVANHVRRFWDPRMRREIIAHYKKGGAGLDELPRSGIGLLADE